MRSDWSDLSIITYNANKLHTTVKVLVVQQKGKLTEHVPDDRFLKELVVSGNVFAVILG